LPFNEAVKVEWIEIQTMEHSFALNLVNPMQFVCRKSMQIMQIATEQRDVAVET
jgi:hypothetical protein